MQWGINRNACPQIYQQNLPIAYVNVYSVTAIDAASNTAGVEYLSVGASTYKQTMTAFYVLGNQANRASGFSWHTIGY